MAEHDGNMLISRELRYHRIRMKPHIRIFEKQGGNRTAMAEPVRVIIIIIVIINMMMTTMMMMGDAFSDNYGCHFSTY